MRMFMLSAAYPPDAGGVATHVADLAHGIVRSLKKSHVYVLASSKDQTPRTYRNGRLLVWKFGKQDIPNFFGRRAPYEDIVSFALQRCHEVRPDFIHAHDLDSVQVGCMLRASFRIPLIATIHRVPKPWRRARYTEAAKDSFIEAIRSYKLANLLVVPSRASREVLLNQGFHPDKVAVVPHGIRTKYLASFSNDKDLLRQLNITTDLHLILCPVRADAEKDPVTFVRAAALLKASLSKERFIFLVTCCDTDPDYSLVKAVSSQSGLEEGTDIIFRSFERAKMPTLYRRASICVIPSRRESFGQTALEAFVLKAPVIAANTTGLKEIVKHGSTGLVFTEGDPGELAQHMKTFIERPDYANQLRMNALDRVERFYTADQMVKRYQRVFRRIRATK